MLKLIDTLQTKTSRMSNLIGFQIGTIKGIREFIELTLESESLSPENYKIRLDIMRDTINKSLLEVDEKWNELQSESLGMSPKNNDAERIEQFLNNQSI